jgi:hypothetical protein
MKKPERLTILGECREPLLPHGLACHNPNQTRTTLITLCRAAFKTVERSINRVLHGSLVMSIEDALQLINDSKLFLEPYKMYGQMITDGIAQLEKLEKLIQGNAYDEAYKLSCTMYEQIAGYRSLVPQLADNLDKIREILKHNLRSTRVF